MSNFRRAVEFLAEEHAPQTITGEGGKLAKQDSKVEYRVAPQGGVRKCGKCHYYSQGSCSKVRGGIDASYTCNLWKAK